MIKTQLTVVTLWIDPNSYQEWQMYISTRIWVEEKKYGGEENKIK